MNSIFARLYNQSAARRHPLSYATHYSYHFLAHQPSRRINKCYHNTSEIIMATSTSTYSLSFEKLKGLQRSAHPQHELTLPERPSGFETDSNPYLDSAIGMLGESAAYLYDNHHYMDSRFDGIETRIDKLDTRVDKLDTRVGKWFDYVNKRFVKIEDDIKAVKDDVKAVKDDVKAVKDDVNQRFDEARAINFNRFARVLDAEIEKVAAPVQDENGQKRYQVGAGFPETVEEFWLLKSNSKPNKLSTRLFKLTSIIVGRLTSLARHYSIKGWKKWQCLNRENPEATQYDRLEDAIAEHPQRCLRVLAAKWNLEYEQLERIDGEPEEIRPKAQKRKADDETETRRVKPRNGGEFETEISIISSQSEEVIIKSKTTKTGPEVRVHRQITLEEVLQQYHPPGQSRMSVESAELGYETSSSARAARLRVHAAMEMDPPVSGGGRRIPRISKVMDVKPKDSEG